jgi:hypothetical protein
VDALALIEAIDEAVFAASDIDFLTDFEIVSAVAAGLPDAAPAFVLRERWSGREWIVGVKMRRRDPLSGNVNAGTRPA